MLDTLSMDFLAFQ
ncbi:hypothetical protein ID866_8576 [Astraeus odoratus]|nr:hypothetical protein ID866_8576 [Astraeus odoratus]